MYRHTGVKLDFAKYERTLNYIRNKTLPKSPTTCEEIRSAFSNDNILSSIGTSQHEGVFFDGIMEFESYSFCVFSSKYAIKLIEEKILPYRRVYMMDATFKICSLGPFKQFLIIYIAYIDKVMNSIK